MGSTPTFSFGWVLTKAGFPFPSPHLAQRRAGLEKLEALNKSAAIVSAVNGDLLNVF
jgi:hypothetical protein